MPVRLCAFLLPVGRTCRTVSVTGQTLCRAHESLQARARRQLRARKPRSIRLSPINGRQSIVRSASRIVNAIGSGSIHIERAEQMLRQLYIASQRINYSTQPPAQPHPLKAPGFALAPARLYNQPNPPSQTRRGNALQPPTGKTK